MRLMVLKMLIGILIDFLIDKYLYNKTIMTKEFIDNYAGQRVKLTMIDDAIYEGLLW